jgi:hypothetical protein
LDFLLPYHHIVPHAEGVHNLFAPIFRPQLAAQPNNVLLLHDRNERQDGTGNSKLVHGDE